MHRWSYQQNKSILSKTIKTFNTSEFMHVFMNPDPSLKEMIKPDYGRFFIVPVQDLIKLSKLPVPPARSSTHILIYLTSGVATMRIGLHPVQIKKDECLIVPAGQVFSYDHYEVNEGYIVVFDNDFLFGKMGSHDLLKEFEFLQLWGNPVIKIHAPRSIYIPQTLSRIFHEYTKHGLANQIVVQSHFLAALCELNLCYKPLSAHPNKTAVTLTNRFKKLVYKHIRSNHLVTDYASLLHVSPNHLNKTVREVTQKSCSKWIDETLITEAKVLLFQTNNNISEIAFELGIHDSSYFSRLFKKYEGVTPVQYRKMIETS
jgi:AraC family transcriptional regulator, transcriptional activator of pobA